MSSKDDFKSKPCWVYIDGEPATSYQELIKGISSQSMEEKEQSLMKLIKSMLNDENYPTNIMIKVINSLLIVEDQRIKKLLLLFWEVNAIDYIDIRKEESRWWHQRRILPSLQ